LASRAFSAQFIAAGIFYFGGLGTADRLRFRRGPTRGRGRLGSLSREAHLRRRVMKAPLRVAAVCLALGWLSVGSTCLTPLGHDAAFTGEGLLRVKASELRATLVSAHLDVPIREGRNVLWCGTFQLAWNEACSSVGEDLRFDQASPVVDALNKKSFTKADLDEGSYVALAGFVRDGIHKRIRGALEQKFEGLASAEFIPREAITPRPQDFVAYAYLFKNLEFATPFERLERPIAFGGKNVSSFGMEEPKPDRAEMYPQVLVLDYKDMDDFVIELKTTSRGDRLILAKTRKGETLAATVGAVLQRASASPGRQAGPGDVLQVPRLNFDITRTYTELEGKLLVPRNQEVAKDLGIVSAVQNTRFQMDERGVRLRSESHAAFACSAEVKPQPRYIMIFDKPFLILLERAGAKSPYFVLWIDNPELLIAS